MAQKVRFVKLGTKGSWEVDCIKNGTIQIGFESPMHQQCLNGHWDAVQNYWLEQKDSKQVASNFVNQLKSFYESSEDDIWITFHQRRLYWCKAYRQVEELDDGNHIRRVIGAWSCTDANGKELTIDNLDGRITKVQGFRGTICNVEMPEYLVRKINGKADESVVLAQSRLDALTESVIDLIKGLWWYDFELLVDLVFSKSGWHRYSVLGKTEKDIDLDLFSPTTGRRAFAQVKSHTTQAELDSYFDKYAAYEDYQEFFFIYHTASSELSLSGVKNPNAHVLGGESLAKLVISTGLVYWLIEKRR
ncbi:hypothetical protein AB4T45_004261 [Vibrio parahaemolyticus]